MRVCMCSMGWVSSIRWWISSSREGTGAGNQASPDAITPVGGGEAVYQYWTNPLPEPVQYGGVAFTGTHRTVYFSFGFEAINRAIDRDQVLQATLDYLGTCTQPEAPQASFTASPGAGSRGIQFTNTSQGTPLMSYHLGFWGQQSCQQLRPTPSMFMHRLAFTPSR